MREGRKKKDGRKETNKPREGERREMKDCETLLLLGCRLKTKKFSSVMYFWLNTCALVLFQICKR